MLLFLVLLLGTTSSFRFVPFDSGLPRSGQWRHGFDVGDMNGDGAPDLVFTSPRKNPGPPVIFLNQGGGRWSRWQETRFPALPFDYGATAVADFDGNGANDIAVASHYTGVVVVLGDGKGTFVASQEGLTFRNARSPQGAVPFSARAVVATDWNGDGLMDVAAVSDGPRPGDRNVQLGVTLFQNLGAAWKPLRAVDSDVVFGDAIAAGDVDGDRRPDLVTASFNSRDRRVLRLGAEKDLRSHEVATSVAPTFVRAADLHDFDGDARDEIVIAYATPAGDAIELVSLDSTATPPRRLWSEGGSVVAAVAAGDVNGDRAPDVVAALGDGRLLTFRGDGRGFVTRDLTVDPPSWRRGCAAYAVRVADLDRDGRAEIIAAFAGEGTAGCATGGGVEVWTFSGSSTPRRRSARH